MNLTRPQFPFAILLSSLITKILSIHNVIKFDDNISINAHFNFVPLILNIYNIVQEKFVNLDLFVDTRKPDFSYLLLIILATN
ncbi:hypothetical protein BpHYR1_000920 [Brachionus plicatilis]|uniref:Uncharacterized protein n=1 Tax=Brachionus plicatilis TaxID=10195 RepID=A0A3M7QAQ8_BRAPC|nr:hypothetical protein BpHYR1_000920 [Brachionus plicatilis]